MEILLTILEHVKQNTRQPDYMKTFYIALMKAELEEFKDPDYNLDTPDCMIELRFMKESFDIYDFMILLLLESPEQILVM